MQSCLVQSFFSNERIGSKCPVAVQQGTPTLQHSYSHNALQYHKKTEICSREYKRPQSAQVNSIPDT